MIAIETTATVEDERHLHLDQPMPPEMRGSVRLIVLMDEERPEAKPAADFHAAIGSYYREHPEEPRRTSDEWLAEMREGERD